MPFYDSPALTIFSSSFLTLMLKKEIKRDEVVNDGIIKKLTLVCNVGKITEAEWKYINKSNGCTCTRIRSNENKMGGCLKTLLD